jgi:ketosteroid isomerase-like protein
MKALKILLSAPLLLSLYANAQKGIDGVIRAERSFAAYSVAHGTKDAFLKFIDSNAVMFDKGQPVNALKLWSLREKRPGILNWQPQFAEIAASGDFGYTLGPWTFQPRSVHDSVVARGSFFTIWHCDEKGEWKFLFDIGNDRTPVNPSVNVKKIEAPKLTAKPDTEEMLASEKAFCDLQQKLPATAYEQYLSGFSILNRNNMLPAYTDDEKTQIIKATPAKIYYTVEGSGIASTGDLAYVYGTATLNERTEGYLRVWRKEKEGWKIAMEALRH